MVPGEIIKIDGECDVAVGFSTGPGSIVENVMSDSQISPPLNLGDNHMRVPKILV